jgi:phosphoribosyl-ATP pyrophosphohydrolase/phosphoribosyl-AMP cyclohydrolase
MSFPDFKKENGLLPAIIQDVNTNEVLMLGYMNEESYKITLDTGKVTFYSRSRSELWVKGATSGNYFNVKSHRVDCDLDTILFMVNPAGPACHRGTRTCFDDETAEETPSIGFLTELQDILELRKKELPEGSYTSKMFKKGLDKLAQKVGEEAVETVIAAKNNNEELLYESSDLLFHLMMLLTERGMRLEDLSAELKRRHQPRSETPNSN